MYSAEEPVSVILQTLDSGSVTGTGGSRGIQTALGGSGRDTLAGNNADNTWNISAESPGHVIGKLGNSGVTFTFVSFETLIGGTGVDVFNVSVTQTSALAILVDGGGQLDDVLNLTDLTPTAVMTDHPTGIDSGYVLTDYLGGSESNVTYRHMRTTTTNPDPDQSYVQSLYHNVLDRNASSAEIAAWIPILQSGAAPLAARQEVANGILTSQEFFTLTVDSLYEEFLGRSPDPSGLGTDVSLLTAGHSALDIEAGILASPEYFTLRGQGTNAGFVQALYQDVLLRAPDPAGAAAQNRALSGGVSRGDLVLFFLGSAEYVGIEADQLYRTYLHRNAEPAGRASTVSALSNGQTVEQMSGYFATSEEYTLNDGGDANKVFVAQVYRDLLGREAGPSELAAFGTALDNGASTRLQVASAIQHSAEYYTRIIDTLYETFLGREPDPSGLDSSSAFLAAGHTAQEVAAGLIGSTEYYEVRGHGTNSGFVQAIYQDVLNRAPDPGGAAAQAGALAGGESRADVAAYVLAASERFGARVDAAYQNYLHRAVDPGGYTGAVTELQAGMTDEQLAAILLSSTEYFNRI